MSEALRTVAKFVIDHPRAARGAGDTPHADWTEMQRLATVALASAPDASLTQRLRGVAIYYRDTLCRTLDTAERRTKTGKPLEQDEINAMTARLMEADSQLAAVIGDIADTRHQMGQFEREALEQECADVDRLLAHLSIRIEQGRSEGGRLLVAKIASILEERGVQIERGRPVPPHTTGPAVYTGNQPEI